MPTTENDLVADIARTVRTAYPKAWLFKVVGNPYQMTGVPDLLCCVDGLLVGLEVKHVKPGETREHALARTSPTQRVQISRINIAGGIAGTVTTPTEALDLIRVGLDHHERERRDGTEA